MLLYIKNTISQLLGSLVILEVVAWVDLIGVNVSLKWIASTRPSSLWFLVMVAGRFYMPAGPKKHLKASLAALEEKVF